MNENVFLFLPENFTHRGRELCQPSGVPGPVEGKPGLTDDQLFPDGAPSESALFFSIGFFLFFLNTGRG